MIFSTCILRINNTLVKWVATILKWFVSACRVGEDGEPKPRGRAWRRPYNRRSRQKPGSVEAERKTDVYSAANDGIEEGGNDIPLIYLVVVHYKYSEDYVPVPQPRIRRTTSLPAIRASNHLIHPPMRLPVIQAFLLWRHFTLMFSTSIVLKHRGVFAVPMNQSFRPVCIAAEMGGQACPFLLFSRQPRVVRLRPGTFLHIRPFSSQLKIYILCQIAVENLSNCGICSSALSVRLPSSPCIIFDLIPLRPWRQKQKCVGDFSRPQRYDRAEDVSGR